MKKSFITLALLAACAPSWGRTLSPAEALKRALATDGAPAAVSSMRAPAQVKAALTLDDARTGQPALYVISRGEESGYLVVSADDLVLPLLGYTDKGTFDPSRMPDNLRWWLDQYSLEISEAIAAGATAAEPNPASYAAIQRAARNPIAPKLTTKWDQDAPYNGMCPLVEGVRTYTGCVATAMAQIINYHEWPAKGQGSNSYTWNGQTLSYDFSGVTFDWANMLDTYGAGSSQASKDAVATLMVACGMGVNMNYGTTASGAISQRVPVALREYFNYDKSVQTSYRSSYTRDQWETIVYNELNDNGPVYYSGQAPEGGHAFVCDGYNEGYFHFNWGWSGISDGYYVLSALDPESQGIGGYAGGFNSEQSIVLNFKKPVEGSTLPDPQIVASAPVNAYMSASTLTLTGPFITASGYNIKGRMGLRVYKDGSDEYVTSLNSRGILNLEPAYMAYSIQFNVSSLADGKYRAYPVFTPDGSEEYYPVQLVNGDAGYIEIDKTGGLTTATAVRRGTLACTSVDILSPFYVGKLFGVDLNYTYDGDRELFTQIVPILLNSSGVTVGYGPVFNANIETGEGTVQFVGSFDNVNPGSYRLVFAVNGGIDRAGRQQVYIPISEAVDITIGTISNTVSVSIASTAWEIVDADNVCADDLRINASIKASYGYFAGRVEARICDLATTDYTAVSTLDSPNIFVAAPGNADFTISGTFPEAEVGKTYKVYLYRNGTTRLTSNPKEFTVGRLSGIDNIGADVVTPDTEAPVEYFNLQGIRVENPSGGLYIRRQGSRTEKVYVQ